MELFQIQNDEGPCLDCYRSGQRPPAAAGYRAAIREAGVRYRVPMPGQRILPGRAALARPPAGGVPRWRLPFPRWHER